MDISKQKTSNIGLTDKEITKLLQQSIPFNDLQKVLIIPPDITRLHSKAGFITNEYYHLLKDVVDIDILPALGTHHKMSKQECKKMFGDIPYDRFLYHDWRNDVIPLGEIPNNFVNEATNHLWNAPVQIEVNKRILEESYDLIISIGQVVPHEVIGMANYTKNIVIGCGGTNTINQSHMIGAVFGMEEVMGKDHSPVRKVIDEGANRFLHHIPIMYVLTVTTSSKDDVHTHGLFIGDTRKTFEKAVKLSQQKNINYVEKPIKKCVVYLDPEEYKSTWLGNKAIYRSRMAIKDGGELIILAKGVTKFGEDKTIDTLIRKYGYIGRDTVMKLFYQQEDLQNNMSASAHLIHGSTNNRFSVTYAVKTISKSDIEAVNFKYAPYDEVASKYNVDTLKYGWNNVDGEEIFFIPNPALGLWMYKDKLK